jgi:hypothetical protein
MAIKAPRWSPAVVRQHRWIVEHHLAPLHEAPVDRITTQTLDEFYALAVFRDLRWTWPDALFATIAAGVLAALALTGLALPLVDATRHDAVRYE